MLPIRRVFDWDPDLFFDRLLEWPRTRLAHEWRPRMDAYRDDEGLVLEIEAPGVSPDDFTVELEDGVLTVRGSREERSEIDEENRYVSERFSGSFVRRISVPDSIDEDDIAASCEDGVLMVRMPLPEGEPPKGPKRIEVAHN